MSRRIKINCLECSDSHTIKNVRDGEGGIKIVTSICDNIECCYVAEWEVSFGRTVREPVKWNEINSSGENQNLLICPACGQRGVIGKTNRQHGVLYTFYCRCASDTCNHRFTYLLSFKATISPGAVASGRIISDLVRLPASHRKAIISALLEVSD